jgi:hypothetical protein
MPVPDYLAADHAKDVASSINEGIPSAIFAALDELTDEQRLTVFHTYCRSCGSPKTGCYCMRDC